MGYVSKGNLFVIGGAEDKKDECRILKYLVSEAGGVNARISLITTASENPTELGGIYRNVFSNLGAGEINVLDINNRYEANSESTIKIITESTCVFFTGGDQLRITSLLGGTKMFYALHELHKTGGIISGTSAGASIMSGTMIVAGDSNDTAKKCTLKMAPGLGFFDEVLIDQHFHQRGRIGRLLCGVAENPNILGIGIDEDTAIRVYRDGRFEVIGSNSVTVVDGRYIKKSNVSEAKPDEILAIENITLHVLPEGYGFNLVKREVLKNSLEDLM